MHVLEKVKEHLTKGLGEKATYRPDLLEQEALAKIYHSLDPKQQEALNAIGWLLYGPRGSGRSRIMVAVAVINAINNPGMTFTIYDHMGSARLYVDHTFAEVDRVLSSLPHEIRDKFILRRRPIHTIRYGRSEDYG